MKNVVAPVILIILLGALTANSIHQAQAKKIKTAKARISEEKKKQAILGKIKGIEEKLKEYNPHLSNNADTNQFLETINKIISDTEIDLVSIRPLSSREQAGYGFLCVSLKAICAYHQLGDFISKLESSKIFIKVDDIKLKLIEKTRLGIGRADVSKYGDSAVAELVLKISAVYKK
ncbi:MAG: type 4a pilus biogenesis protein PilO [Candidatus Omnitrophota bacterium]|nr:type 4a pilus biogenesis protein PilO [Candidatus Omnitrophota bacterium]